MKENKELTLVNEEVHPVAIQQERYMRLMELALQNSADIASIEKLVELQNNFEAKEARKSFFAALSQFQADLPVIKKKGSVSYKQVNFTFAKLEDIASAIRPLIAENGLSYRFEQGNDNKFITVVCIITHRDGHEVRTSMSAFSDDSGGKNAIQQIASTVSYLRRYTLTGALGITVSDEDDDAVSSQQVAITADQLRQAALSRWSEEEYLKWASGNLGRQVSSFSDLSDQERYNFWCGLENSQ